MATKDRSQNKKGEDKLKLLVYQEIEIAAENGVVSYDEFYEFLRGLYQQAVQQKVMTPKEAVQDLIEYMLVFERAISQK